jgi:hypothetical protein
LQLVLYFSLGENELYPLGLLADVGLQKLLQRELLLAQVQVRVLLDYLADLLPVRLRQSLVEPLQQRDVDKVRLHLLFEQLQHFVVGLVVDGLCLLDDAALFGYVVFY